MKSRILYLPIETKAREFLGKVLLAERAVESGWMVVIGDMTEVEQAALRFPPGAYVEISIPEKKAPRLAEYQKRGHRNVNLCEENIVYIDGKDYCDRKVGPSAMAATDILLTSGQRNERHLRTYRPEGSDRLRMVGNPRFDTLQPGFRSVYEAGAEEIRRRFGRFLMVNTNFSYVNWPFKPGDNYVRRLQRRGMISDDAHAELKLREVERKRCQLEQFRTVLAKIARAGEFDQIIIRPHPSENHDFWRWAEELGMEVRYEDSANSWMLAADAILHTGCTTGIEGLLLDRPVATFLPDPGNEFQNQADNVSRSVTDARSFLDYIAEVRTLDPDTLRTKLGGQRRIASNYVCNLEDPVSARRIMDALEELDLPEMTPREAGFGWNGIFRNGMKDPCSAMREAGRALMRKQRVSPGRRQKFPGLSAGEIKAVSERWQAAGVLDQTSQVRRLARATYVMTSPR